MGDSLERNFVITQSVTLKTHPTIVKVCRSRLQRDTLLLSKKVKKAKNEQSYLSFI